MGTRIHCRIHPPPTHAHGSWCVDSSEIDSICAQSVGVPVRIEHDPARVVGRVEKVWISPTDGWMCAQAWIESADAISMISRGELNELAFSLSACRDATTHARTSAYEVNGIDLVRRSCFGQQLVMMP